MKVPNRRAFEAIHHVGLGPLNEAYAHCFSGLSYFKELGVIGDEGLAFNQVSFEPGCRIDWHIHHAQAGGGQVLICTAGEGWYQAQGQPAQSLSAGDLVIIPANVKHWHGAKCDSWFSHIAVSVPGVGLWNELCEPVSDADYAALAES